MMRHPDADSATPDDGQKSPSTTSVLTLVRGRERQLTNLIEGLSRQKEMPSELVIAWMQEEVPADLRALPFPVRHIHVKGDALPLAAARNRAAETAKGDVLIYLDVDCIPSPGLVNAYRRAGERVRGLFLGEVYYLAGDALEDGVDFERLDKLGVPHPSKPSVPIEGMKPEPDHGQLWGLSFAIRRDTYLGVGGMDEGFRGYGGEETDFAARLAEEGLPFYWVAGARAYHQHHVVHVPPLNHFTSILENAERFRRRHGRWCMEYWLNQMSEDGFIRWAPERADIQILRHPTRGEIEAARQPDDRRFS